MKSFGDQEREIIRLKLLDSCEECWSKYGYKRTNIREMCDMAGISTGAFYMFFPSKEHLFFETAQHVGDKIGEIIYRKIPRRATKRDFAIALKEMYGELGKVVWYVTLESELALIVRKLPPGYIEDSTSRDEADLAKIIRKYHLVPKVKIEKIVKALSLLSLSLTQKKLFGEGFFESFFFLLDAAIDRMFE